MTNPHIDLLAVLIAAFANALIGFVWYSRWLFQEKSEESAPRKKMARVWGFGVALLSAYILGFFEMFLGVTTVSDGMFVGFLVWLGFVATTQISQVIWGKMHFKKFLIHSGCQLLAYLSMGGIIGA
jgi:hypothetical protein